jgi:hypothetical protein
MCNSNTNSGCMLAPVDQTLKREHEQGGHLVSKAKCMNVIYMYYVAQDAVYNFHYKLGFTG